MSVARVTEITAASKISIEDAIKKGVARADETLDNIKSVWVQDVNAKVKDGEIVFPLSAKGHAAVVEGQVEKVELTQKQAIGWLSHEAEERGVPFDSTTVTGPMTIWRIKGAGAEIKG